jgi:hypothetical protein
MVEGGTDSLNSEFGMLKAETLRSPSDIVFRIPNSAFRLS